MNDLNLRLLPGVAAALMGTMGSAYAQPIQVIVDGERVHFRGQPPVVVNDRVLVPLRGVFEDLGAQVNWNPMNQTVTARRGDTRIRLTIGEKTASVNDQPVNLDVPAQVVDGSTLVPLRFVSEALGERVRWEAQTQTVSVFQDDAYAFDRHREDDHHWRKDEPNPVPLSQQPVQLAPPVPPPPAPPQINIEVAPPAPVPPHPSSLLDADTVLPTQLDINIRRWRPGDRFTTSIAGFPGLPPNCEVSGFVSQVGPHYYGQPRTISLHFDVLTTPDGRRHPIDGTAVPIHARTVVRPGDGYGVAPGFERLYLTDRVGIRLNRPLQLRPDQEGNVQGGYDQG